MKEKILVTGASGLVGSRFIELYSSEYEFITPEYPSFDLTDPNNVGETIDKFQPEAIVNFAAYTNVTEAENQRDDKNGDSWKVNVEGTKNLAAVINPDKVHFIQISTDYVFSGLGAVHGPYPENMVPETDSSKLSWYGFTKAEGERAVKEKLGEKQTILRLIYPVRAKFDLKLDYLRKPLSLFDQGKLYPLFNDQQVTIAFIDEIALALDRIIKGKIYGTFHVSTPDTSSPYELVNYLIEKTRGVKNAAQATSFDTFLKESGSSPVRYVKYGGLQVKETEKKLGIKFRPWRKLVDTLVEQGIGN
jgi:dTDP-4-dehydrorhamnose reductase